MTRQKLAVSAAAAVFALTLTPALARLEAQGSRRQAGSRPSNGAESTGSAVPRNGGASSGSSSAGSSSSGSSGSESSSSSRTPRGTSATGSDDRSSSRDRAAVPAYSRPRDGRTATGSAAERRGPLPTRGEGHYPSVIYDPYYSSYYGNRYAPRYSYWSPFGYGYGLGYLSYDPYLFGGYGYDPYGYGYGYQGYQGYRADQYRDVGSLRLKVKPTSTEVLIDGYFVGVVDSFDGVFQRLGIESGAHRVELRAEGYEPVQFEVMITPGETITYKGEMKRIP